MIRDLLDESKASEWITVFKGEDVERQFQLLTQTLMPVMVWFHGGGYVRGGSQQFGPQFMMREDVVLVTVNYRLGVLGISLVFLIPQQLSFDTSKRIPQHWR